MIMIDWFLEEILLNVKNYKYMYIEKLLINNINIMIKINYNLFIF